MKSGNDAQALIALGGNVGDVLQTFRAALGLLVEHGLRVKKVSRAYRTRPLVRPDACEPVADYWNAVCCVQTRFEPRAVLEVLLGIENRCGRVRPVRWASRTLDLDLLLVGDAVVEEPGLTVPHPGLRDRLFVLWPLLDIAPELRVPPDGIAVPELIARHPDPRDGILEVVADWRESGPAAATDEIGSAG